MSLATYFVLLLSILSILYAGTLCGFLIGLRRLRRNRQVTFQSWPTVSVIVPARNEAEVLERTLHSLLAQDYPGAWDILVVDDRSEDQTPQLLAGMCARFSNLRSVRVSQPNPPSPKKNALAMGIRSSTGEIVATTDADCLYDPAWLRQMVSYFSPGVGVVAGLTIFDLPVERVPFWQKVQWLDFFVQNFMAAGATGAGVPASCNGSNLFFRRAVYKEISGYGNVSTVVSGDDVLFAQRVSRKTRWKIVFAQAPKTIVRSLPVLTLRELVQQRLRWASKGLAYRFNMLTFLFGLYSYYLLMVSAPIVAVASPPSAVWIAAIFLWKWSWDFVTVRTGCRVFNQGHQLAYFPAYAILQTISYPIIGIAGLLLPYRWKGDWYRTARLPKGFRRGLVRLRRVARTWRAAASD